MLRIWSSISFSFSQGEGSSKFMEKSLNVIWLTQDVIFVLLFAVSSATASFVEASSSNLCLVACDLVRQVNELKNSLLKNVDRQLENSLFGLSGSQRNLSLYRKRIISNFASVLNLRHLDVLVHLIVHFSDGSVVFVHSCSKTASEDVFTRWQNLFSVFLST